MSNRFWIILLVILATCRKKSSPQTATPQTAKDTTLKDKTLPKGAPPGSSASK